MKRTLFAAVVLMVMVATSSTVLAEPPSHRYAVAFVEQAKLGQNLPAMALAGAQRTVTFSLIVSKLGKAGALEAVSDEIHALLPIYQPKWDENLAQAYESAFTEEELSSLVSDGRSSKYVSKVMAQQGTVGKQMQSTSTPILIDLTTQALNAVVSRNP